MVGGFELYSENRRSVPTPRHKGIHIFPRPHEAPRLGLTLNYKELILSRTTIIEQMQPGTRHGVCVRTIVSRSSQAGGWLFIARNRISTVNSNTEPLSFVVIDLLALAYVQYTPAKHTLAFQKHWKWQTSPCRPSTKSAGSRQRQRQALLEPLRACTASNAAARHEHGHEYGH